MMVKFRFELKDFIDIEQIHLITVDEDGNKIDKIGLEDIQEQPQEVVLEIIAKNTT